ncbi:hypothetical protein EBESD8_16800 [Rhodococcus aetherivorans]|nr:hypothetical protein EBESD8_16800 [Rhodococcus aetherivorans]
MVPLGLELAGEIEQHRHGRQEHARGLALAARSHEPADGLGEEQRRRRAGGVHAHREPRHVDAFGHHSHRHHPALGARIELRDAPGGRRVVGQDECGRLAGELLEDPGIRAGHRLVAGDDQSARVGHPALAQLLEPRVGGGEDGRDPVAGGIERGPPRPGGLLGAERLAEPRRVLLPRAVAPPGFTGVGEEHHRAHDAVGERVGVAVRVVGPGLHETVGVRFVHHERDGAVVAAERRSGQGEAAGGVAERLPDALAPALGVAAVVDLVEDHQGAARLGADPMLERMRGDLRIGHHDAVEVARRLARGVGEVRVQRDAGAGGRGGPLVFEVLGRGDDRHLVDGAVAQQLARDAQRERGLTGARGRDGEEIPRTRREVLREGPALPGAQLSGGGGGRCSEGLGAHRLLVLLLRSCRWFRSAATSPGGERAPPCGRRAGDGRRAAYPGPRARPASEPPSVTRATGDDHDRIRGPVGPPPRTAACRQECWKYP